jgi:hypothetical protein
MKKSVLTVGIAMLFVVGSATFIGCGNSENHEAESHEHHEDMEMSEEQAQYQCPMKCEGDKTYPENVPCPKCGMDLKELEEEKD